MIKTLVQECTEAGLCSPSYFQEVLCRKKLSRPPSATALQSPIP